MSEKFLDQHADDFTAASLRFISHSQLALSLHPELFAPTLSPNTVGRKLTPTPYFMGIHQRLEFTFPTQ